MATPRDHRARNAILCALALVVTLAAADALATLALVPYDPDAAPTFFTWVNYRMHEDSDIDAVIVGSSTSLEGMNAATLDEELGTTTFNMGAYGQSFGATYQTLKTVINDHHVTRAYVGVSFESLSETEHVESALSFTRAKMYRENLVDQGKDALRYLTDPNFFGTPKSIGFFFPWTVSHVQFDLGSVLQNIRLRAAYTPEELVEQYDMFSDNGYTPPLYTHYDEDKTAALEPYPTETAEELFLDQNVRDLQAMCDLCSANGTTLYVIVMPRPRYDLYARGEGYALNMRYLESAVTERGGVFVDANMMTDEAYAFATEEDFYDFQHLNYSGSVRFSKSLAAFVRAHEAGEDTSSMFFSYDQWDEVIDTLDYLALVKYTIDSTDETLLLSAVPYCSPDLEVEYQWLVKEEDGSYTVLYDYSDGIGAVELARAELPLVDGLCTIRLNARVVGSDAEYEHYFEQEFVAPGATS